MTQQEILVMVAQQIEEAKKLLLSAKELAESNNVAFSFEGTMQSLYEETTGEYPDWYSSNCY